ncbi:N-6 DNA methylase [Nitrosopumilus sp. b3]|uniref:HsdM family class I SAM-dependent methyltransferase n=1 Tax=Nitrosopumilus sp. b3 TaxID=2109909 RepID=UPI001C71423C|nr:N-6 DNA methylase [Nitrosopumilus sp. b3]
MNNNIRKMSKLELIPDHKKIDKGGDQRILEGQTCSLMNERITENIVREHFKKDALVKDSKVIIEEQDSINPRINKLLKNASKKGLGKGKPEFIISFKDESNLIIVIECKADITKHESKKRDNYSEYAVDGVLLYSSFLSKSFDVISIAVSGETKKELKVSQFLQIRDTFEAKDFLGVDLLSLENYLDEYKNDEHKLHQDFNDLMVYSKQLNERLHKLKIKESIRSLLISGILLALRNEVFKTSYEKHKKPKTLSGSLVTTISEELKEGNIQDMKIQDLEREYSFIRHHESFVSDVNILKDIIKDIDTNIHSFIKTYKHDVLGQFYIEFLRYANSDKGLGIVLTPPHITDLFVDLAKVNKDSIVFDNCCGTGGFLISAMNKMIDDAKGNNVKIKDIKNKQIIGFEFQNDIFALACSNMFIHKDGSSSIFKGDCFKPDFIEQSKEDFKKKTGSEMKPNVGFLNPPYKNIKSDTEEFEFVLNNLEILEPNGTCIAIIPMSCVTATEGHLLELKKRLMEKHTLDAVFSMPNELFFNSNVGTICAIVVFKAHQPHPKNKETFLGYWKDDGYVKTRRFGRADYNNKWEKIRTQWLDEYENKKRTPYCFTKLLTPEDEWCVEAYMQVDYSILKEDDFVKSIKDYVSFKLANSD